jgi:uncharacterized membrane protein YbhN (UPF0104 family)
MDTEQTTVKVKRTLSKTRIIRWAGTLIATALFLWLLLRQDWAVTWEKLASTPLWLLPLVFALYFLGMVINAVRWNTLLRAQGIRIPLIQVLKILITGAFASNFLPSTIGGDSVRVVSLLRYDAELTVSLASVVLDRLLNVIAMMTVLPFSFAVFGPPGMIFQKLGESAGGMIAITGAANGWAGKWLAKLTRWMKRTREILGAWLHRPGVLVFSFVLSWLSSFVVFVAVWILARGLGMGVALYQVMGVMALTYVVSLLPISINGYGVREVAVTTLYVHLGATLEQASALAVVTRFVLLLEALPGAIWLPKSIPSTKEEEAG